MSEDNPSEEMHSKDDLNDEEQSSELEIGSNASESLKVSFSNIKYIILVLFLIGAFFRFYDLGSNSLWLDEVTVFEDAFSGQYRTVSTAHSAYIEIVGFIIRNFSDSHFAFRFWSALTGTLAIPFFVFSLYRLLSKEAAIFGGIALTFSPFLIFYARDGNYYGAMTFYTCLQIFLGTLYFQGYRIFGLIGIFVVSAITHKNHPIASIFSVFIIFSIILDTIISIYQNRKDVAGYLKNWKQKPAPVIALLVIVIAGPVIYKQFSPTIKQLSSMISFSPNDIRTEVNLAYIFSLFMDVFGSIYHKGPLAFLRYVLGMVMLLMLIGGLFSISSLKKTPADQRSVILFMIVTVLSIAAIFIIITTIENRAFYPRYTIFLLPGSIIIISMMFQSILGYTVRDKQKQKVILYSFSTFIGVTSILLSSTFIFPDHSNFKKVQSYLDENEIDPDDIYTLSSQGHVIANWYLDRNIVAGAEKLQSAEQHDKLFANWLKYFTYGHDEVYFLSSWRYAETPEYWEMLEKTFTKRVEGLSVQSSKQDSILYVWDREDRVLLPNVSVTFEVEAGEEILIHPGTWKIISDDVPAELKDLMSGNQLESSDIQVITSSLSATITAVPDLPNKLDYGPYDVMNMTDDFRNREITKDGTPLIAQRFDGHFSYLIHQPDDEERHLVIKNWKDKENDPKNHAQAPLIYAVAVDGIHYGIYQANLAVNGMNKLEIPLSISPGNHRIDIYVTRLRLSDPYHTWFWGGIEWNVGKSLSPAQSMEEIASPQNLNLSPIPTKTVPWGEKGSTELAENLPNSPAAYNRKISDSTTGPSGEYVLEFNFELPFENEPTAYVPTFSQPVRVPPGGFFAYSTHIKAKNNYRYAISLFTIFLNEENQQMGSLIGKQQLLKEPFAQGWRRYVEILPVPKGAFAAVPGIYVYPPNTKKLDKRGEILVDAITPMNGTEGPFEPVYTGKQIYFSPYENEWKPGPLSRNE